MQTEEGLLHESSAVVECVSGCMEHILGRSLCPSLTLSAEVVHRFSLNSIKVNFTQ